MGPEPSSPPGTAQVDGTLAQWAQLLRALAPGAGPPPGRKESMPIRMAGSQGSSHLPICWGSLAQEETQVTHPSQAALPLRELTGVRGVIPYGSQTPTFWRVWAAQTAGDDFIAMGPGGPGLRHCWRPGFMPLLWPRKHLVTSGICSAIWSTCCETPGLS